MNGMAPALPSVYEAVKTEVKMVKLDVKQIAPIAPEAVAFDADNVVVSISGGKDSAALLAWAMAHFPKEKIKPVHAVIDIDWKETMDVVKSHVAHYGLGCEMVQAVDRDGNTKGFISMMLAPRTNRKTGEVGQQMFPSMEQRLCTSTLKTAPIDKYVRTLKGKTLVLIGERREESSNRAKLVAFRPDEKLSAKGREVVKYSPILDMKESDVWGVIHQEGLMVHPCYGYGVKRASCAICIFSSDEDIKIAAKHAPEVVQAYLQMEAQLDHTFRYKPATKKRGEVKERVADILKRVEDEEKKAA